MASWNTGAFESFAPSAPARAAPGRETVCAGRATPARSFLDVILETNVSLTRSDAWAIARHDAHGQAALVRDGAAPADALVEAAILRIEDIDPALNAVSYRAFDHARAVVKAVDRAAPMAAVPVLLKASLAYPGFPQTSGSRARKNAAATTAYPFAQRLDAAGLVSVGMSAMPEFGLLCSGEALLTGPTLNPWDP